MTGLKQLFKKMFNKETLLYIIFGLLTTAVDFVVFSILYYGAGTGEIFSNTISWSAAVIFAFITNKIFVFNSSDRSFKKLLKEIPSFVSARLISLLVTDIFLVFARNISMNMLIAKLLISVVVIISNYLFSKLYIFK